MSANECKILGVRIDNWTRGKIEKWIKNILSNLPKQKFVTTLNPEILLKADADKSYKDILNNADLNLCDGFGIKLVSCLKGKRVRSRYTGADLVEFLMKEAGARNLKILAAVSENSLSSSEEIKSNVKKKFRRDIGANYWSGDSFFEKEETKNAEVVFVNFGAPEQEKFIHENRRKFPKAKIFVGVGGAFDFLTGKFRRAPHWMRNKGLEWLWRLAQEPKRIGRITKATVVFPVKAIFK